MTTVCPSVVTICCDVLFTFPACCARRRITWIPLRTACGWLALASPSAVVQARFWSMF